MLDNYRWDGGIAMLHTTFDSSIVTDFAPRGSLCEWCKKPAVQQLTVIGGPSHNECGFFCSSCGEAFAHAVAEYQAKIARPTPVIVLSRQEA